jgi:hypothetical protein
MTAREKHGDLGLPDSAGDRQGPTKFDDAYINKAREENASALPPPPEQAPGECCEYSRTAEWAIHLRNCTLSRIQCVEAVWKLNYQKCTLRNNALHQKEEGGESPES